MELHVHTRYSKDSLLCFWPLYLRCLARRISVIAVTEHNNIDGGMRFSEFCRKRGGKVSVIVGEEIFTSQGEIIGLFLKKAVEPGLTAKETIARIKEQGGVVYVPHPFDLKRSKTVLQEEAIRENKSDIDCIESHNGRNISPDFSARQLEIARKYGIRQVVGSDAHTLIEAGRNYMRINSVPADRESFIREIENAGFVTAECLRISHKITLFAKLLKLALGGKFIEIYEIFIRRVRKGLHKGSEEN
ncbi:MAG: PHP domain-containing protein [Synergistaceae bacterium]|nr:PHP domain-containing protein [Synergistaceae bacterium]